MNRKTILIGLLLSCLLALSISAGVMAQPPVEEPVATQLVTGLNDPTGSTIGPGQALYVTEAATGTIARVDPDTGEVTTYASGLPPAFPVGFGGPVDITFIGQTAYVLVTLVGSDLFGPAGSTVGVYRMDSPDTFTPIADIGQYNLDYPSDSDVFIPTGVQYAIETFRGGLLVTDGHHNRVFWITRDGTISELLAFGNIVPTGLDVHGNTIYMAEAGPVPHEPEDGKIVSFRMKSLDPQPVAAGARLLVDVEFGRGRTLYALAQGVWNGNMDGTPAEPNTGKLVRVNEDGTFSTVVDQLDRPTSVEFLGNTAYVVTLTGEIWTIENVAGPPYGSTR